VFVDDNKNNYSFIASVEMHVKS